jgi:predicted transcriptional regulator of viral defense system
LVILKVREYIATHQAFSLDDFRESFGNGRTPYNLLVRAVAVGKVDRVARGVYVSRTGRFEGLTPDGYQTVLALAPDAIFAYHTALALNGVAQSASRVIQFYSDKVVKSLVYQGYTFNSYHSASHERLETKTIVGSSFDEKYCVTTPEQTLVDCLTYPARSGGSEEVIRSLSSFQFINNERIKQLVKGLPKASIARIGWFLQKNQESWELTSDDLAYYRDIIGNGTFRFSPSEDAGVKENWDSEWRLYLPASVAEVSTWI